jgi:propionyl-CoA carboxylase beta chain
MNPTIFSPKLRIRVPQDLIEHTAEYATRFANPMVAAQRGFVDDVIDPQDTRRLICNDLRVLRTKKMPEIHKKHSNIPL